MNQHAKSWLKTVSLVFGITVGALTTIKLITLGVLVGLDSRYPTLKDNTDGHNDVLKQARDLADQAALRASGYADDIKAQVTQRLDSTDKRLDRIEKIEDEMLMHSRYIYRAIKGEPVLDYAPLPRKQGK